MAILKLTPSCKDYLWGGSRLRTDFGVQSDLNPLAEAWVLSCHPDGPSYLPDGTTLAEYVAAHPGCLGTDCDKFEQFPILTKFIDAKNNLSIQVHPSNDYALKNEHQYGKTEMWYVLDCEPGAFLYYGFDHEISKSEFEERIKNNTLTEVLNAVPVHKGDCFFIPSGTLHAICKGIVVAEVQQNSNVTYRVYDYGRVGADGKPRALHVEKALDVTLRTPPMKHDFGEHVGDMVQGRQRVKSYKIHIQERVPEDEWFIVENTHEAIIDRETFDKAQGLLKRDTRTAPKQKQLYLFSGFLKCADCGRAMSRIASKGIYVYYQCGTYKSLSKNACTMHSIKNTRLEVGVLFAIQQQVHLAVTYSELVSRINAAPLKKSKSNRLEDMIAVKEKELSKIMRYKQALYQDWKDGEITHNDYRHMSEDYEQQAESINTVLRTLREERDQLENGMAAESPFLTAFLKYQNIDKLTRDILIELIDHIKVYEGGNISVKFKYADEFRRMAEYIELNSQLAVG